MNAQRRRLEVWQGLLVLTVVLGMLTSQSRAESGDEETRETLRLSLSDCIKRAIDDHPSVQEVQWEVAIRKSDLQQAQAGYQPTAEFINVFGVQPLL